MKKQAIMRLLRNTSWFSDTRMHKIGIRAALLSSVILSACLFLSASLLSAAPVEPEIPLPAGDDIFLVSVNAEFGGFDLEISPDFSHITRVCARLEDYRCGGITVTGQIKAQSMDLWPIVNNRFDVDISIGIYKIVISGVIDGDRTGVCGTWVIQAAGTTCCGTWKYP